MSKNRLMKLIVGTTIILAAAFTVQAFEPPDGAPVGNPTYIGMGDLRYIEAQAIPNARAPEGNSAYSGIGDLRRFEAQQGYADPGATASNHPLAGMGDLRRFEAQQFLPTIVTKSTLSP